MARVCVIRQYYFPLDIRVRREVEALIQDGHEVDVICLRRPDEPSYERQGNLTVRRLPPRHQRGGMRRYLFEYAAFFSLSMSLVALLHAKRRYDVVQVHSMPDALVFASWIPKLLGARVMLDLLESMPEFYATKFKTGPEHPVVRLIAWMEQASIRFADSVITCTDQMREAFEARGAEPGKVQVILNTADETLFNAEHYPPRQGDPDRFVLICHGTVEERYGLDTAVRAVALLKNEIPGLRLEIYGEGSYVPGLRELSAQLGVEREVYFSHGFVPMPELLEAIASADAGIVAMKRDAFRDLTLCNKMFEYITMRRPAIVSRTRSVQAYFDESCFQKFDSDDAPDLARAIRELHADPALADRLVERATLVSEPYRWPTQRDKYTGLIRGLARRLRSGGQIELGASAGREKVGEYVGPGS